MTTARRVPLAAVVGLAAGVLLGVASWSAQGPLPGDVAVTRGLQGLFGAEPGWAESLTRTAKAPWVWPTLLVGAALAVLKSGWRGAATVAVAFLLAKGLDFALRATIHVPKPTADLVPVASPSDASGLPSTFGLAYGAAFGAALLLPRAVGGAGAVGGIVAAVVAAGLLVAGACCRVVLGGHWFSQMAASLLVAFGLTLLIGFALRAWRPPADGAAAPAD